MSGEISHLCFLYMTQSRDANKADIFLHGNRLNNAVCAKTTFAVCSPEMKSSWVSYFLQKLFKGTQQCLGVDWDTRTVHESSGLESYKG